jgi:hypothetical protein
MWNAGSRGLFVDGQPPDRLLEYVNPQPHHPARSNCNGEGTRTWRSTFWTSAWYVSTDRSTNRFIISLLSYVHIYYGLFVQDVWNYRILGRPRQSVAWRTVSKITEWISIKFGTDGKVDLIFVHVWPTSQELQIQLYPLLIVKRSSPLCPEA